MDFLNTLSIEGHQRSEDNPSHASTPHTPRNESAGEHLLQRLISGESQATTTPHTQHPPVPPQHQQQESLFDRIGDALSGKQTPPPPPPEPESLFDKIGDVLKGNQAHPAPPPPPPPKQEGLFDKLSDVLDGHRSQPPKKKPEGLMGSINSALGGGSSGEAQEDHLDKTIDFVQEYLLKQGDQGDESAIEQVKDKQIAGLLRDSYKNLTGR